MPEIIVSTEYQKALETDRKIKANAQIMQESLFEVCKGLKEMHDGKLYKELGYQNFNDYCEQEIGIKRTQAYAYLSIIENLPADFVHSSEHFGVKKLLVLSKLDEVTRQEVIENNDIENTSVRELEQKIKALEDVNTALEAKNEDLQQRNLDIAVKLDFAEDRINELENRPVDVAVTVPDNSSEIEKMRELMAKQIETSQEEIANLESKSIYEHEEHQKELCRIKKEYEQKLSEAYASAEKSESAHDMKQIFNVYYSNAIDSIDRLLNFIRGSQLEEKEFYTIRVNELLDQSIAELEVI